MVISNEAMCNTHALYIAQQYLATEAHELYQQYHQHSFTNIPPKRPASPESIKFICVRNYISINPYSVFHSIRISDIKIYP